MYCLPQRLRSIFYTILHKLMMIYFWPIFPPKFWNWAIRYWTSSQATQSSNVWQKLFYSMIILPKQQIISMNLFISIRTYIAFWSHFYPTVLLLLLSNALTIDFFSSIAFDIEKVHYICLVTTYYLVKVS